MKYTIRPSTRFQKDVKRVQKRGYDIGLMIEVIRKLVDGEELPPKYCDHDLSGNFVGCRECHIQPDWLMIYEVDDSQLFLYLIRTGTYSDIF